jgi:integrase
VVDKPLPLSDSTVRNALSPVRACFSTAVHEGVVRHNPTSGAAMPNRPSIEDDEGEVRVLTREQLAGFLDMVKRLKPGHLLFFRFLAATGLRWSEIAALQWRHIRLDDPSPHVRVRRALVKGKYGPPKSKYGKRNVPLPLSIVVELERWRRETEWPDADDLVFHSANGTPLHHSNMRRRVLVPVAEEADVAWMGFKTLRHTCASLLFDSGRNAKQVQRWLGHHSPAFTLATYIHLLSDDVAAPLDLDAEIRPGASGSDTATRDSILEAAA